MAFAKEHKAPQETPEQFKQLRRMHPDGFPPGVDAVLGIRQGGGSKIQSVRFDAKRWSAKRAREWLSGHGYKTGGMKEAASKEWSAQGTIEKVDPDQRLVFGWLYVAKRADGTQVVDHSREIIDPETLEKAAYDFVLRSREGHVMHRKRASTLVECVAFTAEKRRAMKVPDGILPDAIWVGFKVHDDEAWAAVKRGELSMFSLGGQAVRRDV